ncbi:hypothetical protein AMTRI_Chr10g229510 [Amborella trichopoda]
MYFPSKRSVFLSVAAKKIEESKPTNKEEKTRILISARDSRTVVEEEDAHIEQYGGYGTGCGGRYPGYEGRLGGYPGDSGNPRYGYDGCGDRYGPGYGGGRGGYGCSPYRHRCCGYRRCYCCLQAEFKALAKT